MTAQGDEAYERRGNALWRWHLGDGRLSNGMSGGMGGEIERAAGALGTLLTGRQGYMCGGGEKSFACGGCT